MQTPPEPEQRHRRLHRRMKESFAPVYLTALSVIQGVALADLAGVVAEGRQQFTFTHWLLAVLSFVMLIIIWNAYTVQTILWDWIPDLRDAVIPFLFGALELFLNHTITESLSAWLIITVLLTGAGVLANWYGGWRAKEEPENAALMGALRHGRHRFEQLYMSATGVLWLAFGVISWIAGLDAGDSLETGRGVVAFSIVLLTGASMAGSILLNIQTWHRIMVYARTGGVPPVAETGPDDASPAGS